MPNKPKILFIMYDGLTDPLGQSQVLAYIKHLSVNYSFDIVGFEKPLIYEKQKEIINDAIHNLDISWFPVVYHKKPAILSTIYDFYRGWLVVRRQGDKHNYDLIHCRSSAIGGIALAAKKRYGAKLLFDMRGWWADEKKESGAWNSIIFHPIYFYFKKLEKKLFKKSDFAISLTKSGYKEILDKKLKNSSSLAIIPTCVNFNIFKKYDSRIRNNIRSKLGIKEVEFVILYSGSLGGNYKIDIIVNLHKAAKRANIKSRILLVTHANKADIFLAMKAKNIPSDDLVIVSSNYEDVHLYLMAGDIGVIDYKRSFSTIGRSPTKMGEYWACGLPVVSKGNTADVDSLIDKYENSGFIVKTETNEEYDGIINRILMDKVNKELLRGYSIDYFDLKSGVDAYNDIYEKCLSGESLK
jgi:glycosyltransferase involved in cell wall biosynthesis